MFEGGTGRFEVVTGEGTLQGTFRFGLPSTCPELAGTGTARYTGELEGWSE